MAQNYSPFYLAGRFDDVDDHNIAIAELADQVMESHRDFRSIIMQAATKEIADACDRAAKREWLRDREDEFEDGDPDTAWRHYVQGRTEALAHQLEDEVLTHIEDTDEEEDDDEEDA